MSEAAHDAFSLPLALPCEHGLLHGRLALAHDACGLVVLAHDSVDHDARDEAMLGAYHAAGLSTLSVDLLSEHEAHFSDVHNNVPLLAKRLLDFLSLVRNRMQLGELKSLPIGVSAADATAPVAVRVAALRDHDIAAIVCRGGLIDLAGMLYLRSLASPLLVLLDTSDARCIASNTRALQEVGCASALRLIAGMGDEGATAAGREQAARQAADWFVAHFKSLAARTPPLQG